MQISLHGFLGLTFKPIFVQNGHQILTVSHSSFCNNLNASVKIRICLVGPGETPGISNAILWDLSIAQNAVYPAFDGLVVPANHSLWALSGTDAAISYQLSGDQV